jgi:hypothetical protein
MSSQSEALLGYYPDAELVFGIVCPIGVEYRPVVGSLKNYLEQFDYAAREVKISDHFEDIASRLNLTVTSPANGTRKEAMWREIQLGDRTLPLRATPPTTAPSPSSTLSASSWPEIRKDQASLPGPGYRPHRGDSCRKLEHFPLANRPATTSCQPGQ